MLKRDQNKAIELAKIKIQIDIIRNCISKSKVIITGNAFKISLRNAAFFAARFPFVLPSSKYMRELNQETDVRLHELKRYIAISLKNLTAGKNVYIEDLFWFSTHDLRTGYILLYPHNNTRFADYVLFLVETKDSFCNTKYFPGDIKPFREVNHILTSIKGLSEKELGIVHNYVAKTELLTELSRLSSEIKSKSNE
jgi:hypothetical protein